MAAQREAGASSWAAVRLWDESSLVLAAYVMENVGGARPEWDASGLALGREGCDSEARVPETRMACGFAADLKFAHWDVANQPQQSCWRQEGDWILGPSWP